jgi:hypothetical protein
MLINLHYHVLKMSLVSPMARKGCQSWPFYCNFLRLFAVTLLFRRETVNKPSSSGNVNHASGQTNQILMPYKHVYSKPYLLKTEIFYI